jgi:diaminopropionate ammonia-lyase
MNGYALIARELIEQLGAEREPGEAGTGGQPAEWHAARTPTHLFVQSGVGGLAAALTRGLRPMMRAPRRVLVVEPQSAACVAAALDAGHPVQVAGQLQTQAEMLACGLASAPAIKILREHDATSVLVPEDLLLQATTHLRDVDGLATTPSGATGLAGLLHVSSQEHLRKLHQLDETSCVLLIVTEGPLPSSSTMFGTSQI